jgi:hypothetical protein
MRKELDFSGSIKNPYAELLTTPFTVHLDDDSIAYFQEYAREVGMPWQSLLSHYLRACAYETHRLPFELPEKS